MLKGIDVSWYQRDLHLASVDADFVIVKATGGTGYVNQACDMFIQAAKSLGRKYGVYHYYGDGYDASNPTAEADYFVDNCLGYVGSAILILDWEKGGNPYWNRPDMAKQWLDRVYLRTGVKPLIYMSYSLTKELNWDAVIKEGYGLWCAAYVMDGTSPMAIPNYGLAASSDPNPVWDGVVGNVLWQFTSSGLLDGYSGKLDCNYFYGTRESWDAYARVEATDMPPPPPITTTTTTQPVSEPTTTTTTTNAPEPVTTTTTTTAAPDKPKVPSAQTVFINAIVTFVQAFLSTWAATGFVLDKVVIAGGVGVATSLAWNTILKPFFVSIGWLKNRV